MRISEYIFSFTLAWCAIIFKLSYQNLSEKCYFYKLTFLVGPTYNITRRKLNQTEVSRFVRIALQIAFGNLETSDNSYINQLRYQPLLI